jgi:glycosyltransferase involved in cell wall biosynthesis
MRIGLFAHRLAKADATGISRYARELTAALVHEADRADAVVLGSAREAEAPDWVPARVETRVVRWPRPLVHAAWVAGAGPGIERSLGRLDVVHLLAPFPPIRSRAPQVVTVHDIMPFEHPSWYPRNEGWIFRRTTSLVVRRASRIVVPSEYVRGRLVSLLEIDPARITVVPLGVSGAYSRASAPGAVCARFGVKPKEFGVCVGAVSTRKNLIPVIRALGQLGGTRLPLLLVGPDGHGADATDAEIARLGDNVQVRRTGFLPDEEAAALVKAAAVLVHPALEEGFGLVPLEAMAAGTPVIAARVSAVPEVVDDAALLVDAPTDPAAWAAALRSLMREGERRQTLARAGEARSAKFSWSRSASAMLDIYREVANA